MDRDPQSIVEDVRDYRQTIQALDVPYFWPFEDASGNFLNIGWATFQDQWTPTVTPVVTYQQPTLYPTLEGVQIRVGAYLTGNIVPSSASFCVVFILRRLTSPLDPIGLIFGEDNGTGLLLDHATGQVYWQSANGKNSGQGVVGTIRQPIWVGLNVNNGVSTWYLDGDRVPTTPTESAVIPSITPTRIGAATGGTTMRNSMILSHLAYFSAGRQLTDEQFGNMWQAVKTPPNVATHAVINTALFHIGQTRALSDVLTDQTPAGVAARLHYGPTVETVLRAYAWPFANHLKKLTLVGGTATAAYNSDWQYAYRAPERLVRALRIVRPGIGRRYDPLAPAFRVEADSVGHLILTNQEDAELEYTLRWTCPAAQGDMYFREALSWALAARFVPGLAKNERTVQFCLGMADLAIKQAAAAAANEEEPQNRNNNDPPWITARL